MSWMVFDIETALLDDETVVAPEFKPANNLKDPVKIAADLVEKERKWLESAALDPDRCCVTCIGIQKPYQPTLDAVQLYDIDRMSEKAAITQFWRDYQESNQVIGFNILAFDLPVLLQRSRYLGIDSPSGVLISRYRYDQRIVDLADVLTFGRVENLKSKDWYCRRIQIDVEDPTTGKGAAEAAVAGDWETVRAHCRADVEKEAALARWLRVI